MVKDQFTERADGVYHSTCPGGVNIVTALPAAAAVEGRLDPVVLLNGKIDGIIRRCYFGFVTQHYNINTK